MRKMSLAVASLLGLAALLQGAEVSAQGKARIEAGVLECRVSGGAGFIFGSTKELTCTFKKPGPGRDENYVGTISKFGIDVGATTQSMIAWGVLAPTDEVPPGSLAGHYAGVSGEATVGIGVGANVLLGGSQHAIALQPLSVQAQQGLNIAAGIAALTLRPAGR